MRLVASCVIAITLQALSGLNISDFSFLGFKNMPVLHPRDANFLQQVQNVTRLLIGYSERHANIKSALRILLYPFRNKTMESIYLDKIRDTAAINFEDDDFLVLRTICVKQLILSDNYIMEANLNVMVGSRLWNCLEDFDISNNFATHIPISFPFLISLPKIKKLNVCCQRIHAYGIRQPTKLDWNEAYDNLVLGNIIWPKMLYNAFQNKKGLSHSPFFFI